MQKIRDYFESWAAELLCRILVPRKDYDEVQMRAWNRVAHAEHQRDRIAEELHAVYQASYNRDYKCYEKIVDDSEMFRMPETYETHLESMRCGFSLPSLRVISLRDPRQEHDLVKRAVVETLTSYFKAHIEKQLFNLTYDKDARRTPWSERRNRNPAPEQAAAGSRSPDRDPS